MHEICLPRLLQSDFVHYPTKASFGTSLGQVSPNKWASHSQSGQKLGLLGGELVWRQNALLLQVGQPLDLGENVSLLGSLGA
jgi:hypothetical protein